MFPTPLDPLGPRELRQIGIPAPWSFGMADRVRFYELDVLNHVNNTAYLRWFESARVHYMATYEISHYREHDPTLVLRSVTCDYLAPMYLNERYVVTARCASFRKTSFVKEYAVWTDGRLKASGTAVVVMTESDGTTKIQIPHEVRSVFLQRDGAKDDSGSLQTPRR